MTFKWPTFGNEFDIKKHTILLSLAGSRSYGTDHPLSDHDYVGILIPPPNYQSGPFKTFNITGWKDEETTGRVSERAGVQETGREGIIRGINKFFQEASKCNPNVIEALWVPKQFIVHITEEGQMLRNCKHLFLSKKAAASFGGYAMSQLKRMENHYAHGHNGRPTVPTREKFGLPPRPAVHMSQQGASDAFVRRYMHELAPWLQNRKSEEKEAFWIAMQNITALVMEEENLRYDPLEDNWHQIEQDIAYLAANKLGLDSDFMLYMQKEKAYGALVQDQKNYDNWVRNRNPARFELESLYGYDCKHAMHLIRLIRMGKELLTTGELTVYRPDRQELLAIRNGEWEYQAIIKHAKEELKAMYDLARSDACVLSATPNFQELETAHHEIVTHFMKRY